MPKRVRAAVVGGSGTWRDLADLVCPATPSASRAAQRLLEQHFDGTVKVILTDSGTSALTLALRHQGVRLGHEVILASFNCPQVAEAVLATGAHPVLADCDPRTGALDPTSTLRLLTGKTRCIVLTHQFGQLAQSTRDILNIAAAHGIHVIDDSATALGARLDNRRAGQLADVGVLSFGRTKPLSCHGGGALILPLDGVQPPLPATTARNAVMPGVRSTYEAFARGRHAPMQLALTSLVPLRPLHSDVAQSLESRSHAISPAEAMHPRTARLLARRLARLPVSMIVWRERAQLLAQALADLPVDLPPLESQAFSASCFSVRLRRQSRFELGVFLSRRGFQTTWYHYPLHRLGAYRRFARGEFAGTEYLWPRNLVLPHRRLSVAMIAELGRSIQEFFAVSIGR